MKKLTTTALAVLALAAILPTTAKADDPVNPVQGAVAKYFNWSAREGSGAKSHESNFLELAKECLSGQKTPAEQSVDSEDSFKTKADGGRQLVIWDGFLKRSSGGSFTITVEFEGGHWYDCCAIWINGEQLAHDDRKAFSGNAGPYAFTVNLQSGFNAVRFALEAGSRVSVTITCKKSDSLKPPKTFGPGDLWHEDVPEDDDED